MTKDILQKIQQLNLEAKPLILRFKRLEFHLHIAYPSDSAIKELFDLSQQLDEIIKKQQALLEGCSLLDKASLLVVTKEDKLTSNNNVITYTIKHNNILLNDINQDSDFLSNEKLMQQFKFFQEKCMEVLEDGYISFEGHYDIDNTFKCHSIEYTSLDEFSNYACIDFTNGNIRLYKSEDYNVLINQSFLDPTLCLVDLDTVITNKLSDILEFNIEVAVAQEQSL